MSALMQWTWSGTCLTGCTGEATLTATALADGAPLIGHPEAVLSAVYQDSAWRADFAVYFRSNVDVFDLVLPLSGVEAGRISTEVESFRTFTDGTWRFVTNAFPCPPTCSYAATGTGSLWVDGPVTPIPEPATTWLLGTALLLACLVRRWAR